MMLQVIAEHTPEETKPANWDPEQEEVLKNLMDVVEVTFVETEILDPNEITKSVYP